MESLQTLENLCAQFPAQYTAAWFQAIDYVGASEMEQIASIAAMRDPAAQENAIQALASAKRACAIAATDRIGGSVDAHASAHASAREIDQIMMGWGTFFEPVLAHYLEHNCARIGDHKIFCRGSTMLTSDGFRFSPDGAFVDLASQDASQGRALLEMKNPYTRVWPSWDPRNPVLEETCARCADAHMISHYWPQLQTGLHVCREYVDHSLYVEALMRRRVWGAAGACAATVVAAYSKYQRMRVPRAGAQAVHLRDCTPIASGLVAIYGQAPTLVVMDSLREFAAPVDFRDTRNDVLFEHILANLRKCDEVHDGDFVCVPLGGSCGSQVDAPLQELMQSPDIQKSCAGAPFLGIFAWSMLGLHMVRVERDPDFITPEMRAIVARVRACARAPKQVELPAALK